MFNMWNKHVTILYVLLWCVFSTDKSEAQNTASASTSSVAVSGFLDQDPIQPNPVVESLAQSISNGLQNSDVLGNFANFVIYQPYDLIFKVSSSLLVKAGINDTALAKVVADAAEKVGVVTSKLYFGAVGYTHANFLFAQGIATIDNVEPLSLSYVNAIGVVACVDGLIDTESVLHAVVNGVFNVVNSYGLINYDNMAYLDYLFAQELKTLSGVN